MQHLYEAVSILKSDRHTQTGFSQGEPNITNDDELAAQVAGFLEQFLETFNELRGSNFYVSGESVRCLTSLKE